MPSNSPCIFGTDLIDILSAHNRITNGQTFFWPCRSFVCWHFYFSEKDTLSAMKVVRVFISKKLIMKFLGKKCRICFSSIQCGRSWIFVFQQSLHMHQIKFISMKKKRKTSPNQKLLASWKLNSGLCQKSLLETLNSHIHYTIRHSTRKKLHRSANTAEPSPKPEKLCSKAATLHYSTIILSTSGIQLTENE